MAGVVIAEEGYLATQAAYSLTAYSYADLDFGIKNVRTFSQEESGLPLPGNDSVKIPSIISCNPENKTIKE